jgi:preprotein translocase SecE subunit
MADNKTDDKIDDKTSKSEKSKHKRQLRAAPVTVREQGEIARDKSSRTGVKTKSGKIISAPFRVIGRLFRPLGKFKPFRVLGYILAPPYIRNAFKELRLVTWPDGKQSRQLTFAVIVFSLIFGLIAAITDYGLDHLFRSVILKK